MQSNITKSLLVVLVVALIGAIAWFKYQSQHRVGDEKVQITPAYVNASQNLIMVATPTPGASVPHSFFVSGRARGYWFFEASFPVVVTDSKGVVLAQLPAQTESNWMTNELVSFSARVVIPDFYVGPATLTFKKDNPSGIIEKDASVSFPILIQ